jgi:hypothetical protein
MNRDEHILPRIIALLALIVLAVLIWLAVISPIYEWKKRASENLTTSQTENARLNASLSRLRTEKAQLSGDSSLDTVWKAKRIGEATALVQSEISNLAAKHGVMLRSIAPMSAKGMPFASGIGFRVEGEATLDKLTSFLIDLEGNTPALVVERAVVRRLNRPGRTAPQPDVFVQLNLVAPVTLDEEDKT